jgi:DNA-directed RNA polymerase specialized sigma24 family protein
MAKRIFYTLLDDLSLLRKLLNETDNREELWKEFLRRYTKLVLKIIWQFEKDKDRVMDKYLWICTKLAAGNFFILRKFDDEIKNKAPKFTTWLVAVVRNLCVDEHRSTFGRKRLPKALLKLSETDRKIFELYFWKSYSIDEIENYMSLQRELINGALERIEESLKSSRESIYMNNKNTELISLDDVSLISENNSIDISDDLEVLTGQWISKLPEEEKIIVRLKFWEDLSAKDIAKILGYDNEQKIYAVLRNALKSLRKEAEGERNTN